MNRQIIVTTKKIYFSLFYVIVNCFFIFSVLGCDNFFKGSELVDSLEKKIDYASASAVVANVSKENVDDNSLIEPSGAILNKKVDLL